MESNADKLLLQMSKNTQALYKHCTACEKHYYNTENHYPLMWMLRQFVSPSQYYQHFSLKCDVQHYS